MGVVMKMQSYKKLKTVGSALSAIFLVGSFAEVFAAAPTIEEFCRQTGGNKTQVALCIAKAERADKTRLINNAHFSSKIDPAPVTPTVIPPAPPAPYILVFRPVHTVFEDGRSVDDDFYEMVDEQEALLVRSRTAPSGWAYESQGGLVHYPVVYQNGVPVLNVNGHTYIIAIDEEHPKFYATDEAGSPGPNSVFGSEASSDQGGDLDELLHSGAHHVLGDRHDMGIYVTSQGDEVRISGNNNPYVRTYQDDMGRSHSTVLFRNEHRQLLVRRDDPDSAIIVPVSHQIWRTQGRHLTYHAVLKDEGDHTIKMANGEDFTIPLHGARDRHGRGFLFYANGPHHVTILNSDGSIWGVLSRAEAHRQGFVLEEEQEREEDEDSVENTWF